MSYISRSTCLQSEPRASDARKKTTESNFKGRPFLTQKVVLSSPRARRWRAEHTFERCAYSASKMSMMGLHGQDRLLMVVMSDDGNVWRMIACKQKPNMVIAMVTYSYFIQPEDNGGKK